MVKKAAIPAVATVKPGPVMTDCSQLILDGSTKMDAARGTSDGMLNSFRLLLMAASAYSTDQGNETPECGCR